MVFVFRCVYVLNGAESDLKYTHTHTYRKDDIRFSEGKKRAKAKLNRISQHQRQILRFSQCYCSSRCMILLYVHCSLLHTDHHTIALVCVSVFSVVQSEWSKKKYRIAYE